MSSAPNALEQVLDCWPCIIPSRLIIVSSMTTIAPEIELALIRSRSHDSTRADLSRPSRARTDEFRGFSKAGYVKFETALTPVLEGLPADHAILDDPEKAKKVKNLFLVTWLPDDSEDPRNWSPIWRWCMCSSFPP
ncbi:hypothetical protein FISHEDRAFT_78392 [Fistulina hepatica ATCC 64428]|nr:hypothetical protein FISHEDRAFT_78392 [Fistulina hepatica ATCC 64428]